MIQFKLSLGVLNIIMYKNSCIKECTLNMSHKGKCACTESMKKVYEIFLHVDVKECTQNML